jgi:starch synthase
MDLQRGIWHVSRECEGVAEAGGLKDVVAGLGRALSGLGVRSAVVLPRYGFVDLGSLGAEKLGLRFELELPAAEGASAPAAETVEVYRAHRDGLELYLLDSPRTRSKGAIYTYTEEEERREPQKRKGSGHWDAHWLNLILQRGALELALRLPPPALFHCHDGHAAFLPALLRCLPHYAEPLRDSSALLTIHNAGWGYHQEIHDRGLAARLTNLPGEVLERGVLNGAVDPLLLGALFARVNTVSPGYAREIASGQHDALTGGLGEAYRRAGVQLLGVTNGISPGRYDPRFPEHTGLPFAFDPGQGLLEGKGRCRQRFLSLLAQRRQGPPQPKGAQSPEPELQGLSLFGTLEVREDLPLYAFVGRLTGQKGVDVLAGAVTELLRRRAPLQFLLMGQGEPLIEEKLIQITRFPAAAGRLALLIGYNNLAAKYVFASGDFFLVPSQYEPCGLTDLFAQMMGSLPVVHSVGGLVKVRAGYSGYSYREHSVEALIGAVEESLQDFRAHPEQLAQMRRQAFAEVWERYTWDRVVQEGYLPLYREAMAWKPTSP